MDSIFANGTFYISMSHDDDKIALKFEFNKKKSAKETINQQTFHSVTWSNVEIQDFICRLGFTNLTEKRGWFIKLHKVSKSCTYNTTIPLPSLKI